MQRETRTITLIVLISVFIGLLSQRAEAFLDPFFSEVITNESATRNAPKEPARSPYPDAPFMRIASVAHSGPITAIAKDRDETRILTVSEDKTAILRDAETGAHIMTLRPPIGYGNEGKLFACALSRDARYAVLGGITHDTALLVFNAQTGELIDRIQGQGHVICDLAFSPDGQYLAVCLAEGNGVRFYNAKTWELAGVDDAYDGTCFSASFDKMGRCVTAARDGSVRLYDVTLRLVKTRMFPKAEGTPFSVAFSYNGRTIAVSFHPLSDVLTLDGYTLATKKTYSVLGARENATPLRLAWAWDGQTLYGGGPFTLAVEGETRYAMRRWNVKDGAYRDYKATKAAPLALTALGQGRVALGAADATLTMLDGEGNPRFTKESVATLPRMLPFGSLLIANEGEAVGVASDYAFSLTQQNFIDTPVYCARAKISHAGVIIERATGTRPRISGRLWEFLAQGEEAYTADIAFGGERVFFGGTYHLYMLSRDGRTRYAIRTPAPIRHVVADSAGATVAAMHEGGTTHLHRQEDGTEYLALFVPKNKRGWVAYTPEGYYDCEGDADALLGYHVNSGSIANASFFPLSLFRDRYKRPDVIRYALTLKDSGRALVKANKESGIPQETQNIRAMLPPTLRIASPQDGSILREREVPVDIVIRSLTTPPSALRVFVNGKAYEWALHRGVVSPETGNSMRITVRLRKGTNELVALAENASGWSEAGTSRITYAPY